MNHTPQKSLKDCRKNSTKISTNVQKFHGVGKFYICKKFAQLRKELKSGECGRVPQVLQNSVIAVTMEKLSNYGKVLRLQLQKMLKIQNLNCFCSLKLLPHDLYLFKMMFKIIHRQGWILQFQMFLWLTWISYFCT